MATYTIETENGGQITTGIQQYRQALRVARTEADERNEPVYLHDGSGNDPEEVAPVSDDQIHALMAEASNAGDEDQVAICKQALGLFGSHTQHITVRGEMRSYTVETARAACGDVIRDAQAQA